MNDEQQRAWQLQVADDAAAEATGYSNRASHAKIWMYAGLFCATSALAYPAIDLYNLHEVSHIGESSAFTALIIGLTIAGFARMQKNHYLHISDSQQKHSDAMRPA